MFTVSELIKSTGGKLLKGSIDAATGGFSTDSRSLKPGEIFIAIRGDKFNGHDFIQDAALKGASCILAEDFTGGQTKDAVLVKVKDTTKALGDIGRFRRKKSGVPVIAITGSNGKTTTKDMLAWVLSAKYSVLKNEGTKNNHIGLPFTLMQLDHSYDLAVVEMGTNHFGEIGYLSGIALPNIGVITNIGASHLEYFKDLSGVLKEKYSLIRNLEAPNLAVLNNDDSLLHKELIKKTRKPFTVSFGIKGRSDFCAKEISSAAGVLEFKVGGQSFILRTLAKCNIYNCLVAIAIARIFGMEYRDISLRLEDFTFPKGRMNLVEIKSLKFIDDTYNSNPFSLSSSLQSLSDFKVTGRKIFIMGDMLELGDKAQSFHRQAGASAAQVCDIFIAVGQLSKLAVSSAKACGFNTQNLFSCGTSREAARLLFEKIAPNPNDIILVKGSRSMKMEEVFKE